MPPPWFAAAAAAGVGLIARFIHTFLAGTGWSFDEIGVHDMSADHAAGFRGYLEQAGTGSRITVHDGAEQLIRASDLVVFATVAGQPHITNLAWFEHNPLVLHVSLRDLAPVIQLVSTPNALVVHPSLPAKSVRDLIALARSRPDRCRHPGPDTPARAGRA